MTLKVALCDDEASNLEDLRRLLEEYGCVREMEFGVSAFSTGEDLLVALGEGEVYDLIFLDVYLGSSDGLAVARKIRETDREVGIIFATNSRDHAIDGYGVRAIHYLVKPVDTASLASAMDQAMFSLKKRHDRILQLKTRQGQWSIPLGEIIFAESDARIVTIHTVSMGDISFYDRLDSLETQCDDERFLRPHKSYLVNLDHIHAIAGNRAILDTGAEVPISMSITSAKAIFASHTARSI